jgi:hypothetical protein
MAVLMRKRPATPESRQQVATGILRRALPGVKGQIAEKKENRRADWKVTSHLANMGRVLPLGSYPAEWKWEIPGKT